MEYINIDKKEWAKGIEKARENYALFGPVKETNGFMIRELEKDQLPDMTYNDSIMSPKAILFPQNEKIVETTLDETRQDHHIMKRAEKEYGRKAVIGIRPYDAKAVQLVNLNFDTEDYKDPYWCDALASTTFVGLGVSTPGPFDFSTSAGSGPFDETGLDVLLADTDNRYVAKILTDRGKLFVQSCGFKDKADAKQSQSLFENLKQEAENKIVSKIDASGLKEKNLLELHEAPFWDDIAFSCLNCGTCTYVCPTCWCFDIQDETKNKISSRYRNWDSCMSPLFTKHASGHNPRDSKTQRVRQRFMHKLKYFYDKYDQGIMCVGCGRCVKSCPVNIDIREVCSRMNSYEKAES